VSNLSLKKFVLFVHLGDGQVKHLLPNMERIRKQVSGTEIEVVLVATNVELLKEATSRNFSTFRYITEPNIEQILDAHKNEHDHDFREGFWRYSVERLFAITQIYEQYPNSRILHIESDIFTLPNFPYNSIFEMKSTIWCKFNESSDVGALIYIPTIEESRKLKANLLESLGENSQFTDMSALNSIANTRSEVEYFPLAEHYDSTYLNSGILTDTSAKRATQLFKTFHGIFDSAPMGMYLLGQDPRNNWGFVKTKTELSHSAINVSRMKLKFNRNDELVTSSGAKIYCLHAHSKDLKLFSETGDYYFKKLIVRSFSSRKTSRFSPTAFADLIRDYKKRKKLFRLFINLPTIKSIRLLKSVAKLENFVKKRFTL
jgi:hypothetical protein